MKAPWLSILSAFLLGACAITDVTIKPPTATAPVEHRAGAKGRAIHVVVPLEGKRTFSERCGMKKNGYNMYTANVFCSEQPEVWLGEMLAESLRQAGYEVVTGDAAESATVRIEGQLLQFFVEPRIGAFTVDLEADVHVRLVASSDSGLVASRNFFVKGEDVALFATDDTFQSASDVATRHIVKRMTEAVVQLLERFPEIEADEPSDVPAI